VLLVVAAAVSAAIGETLEASAIGAIVVLNAALGFRQEVGAHRAVLALRDSFRQTARVIRGGRHVVVPADEVVVGDLLALREGERVAADARVAAAVGLDVDESALTGESLPVEKCAVVEGSGDTVYAGTAVVGGHGEAFVAATGSRTELGRLALLAERARRPATPLQRRTASLARSLGVGAAVLTAGLGAAMLARGESAQDAFLLAVAVAVAAVPEGLAATVTVSLALGARAMADRGAIVSRLAAVETLGETTVVCSDKTGTLTQNRLTLARVLPAAGETERSVLEAAVLASAEYHLDVALQDGAAQRGVLRAALLATRTLVRETPLDAKRRSMTLVYEDGDGVCAFAKGAPETLLESSDPLGAAAARWGEEGLRVLAVARGRGPLEPVGLIAFRDPLRTSAPRAVADAQAAGIRVKMLTGDHRATASTIGAELGLDENDVHARVTPAEKLELVRCLQDEGEVVAVTGDGVNDAPALRKADVGIAMGLAGTDVAREAADLVLTDDDFSTIVAAIREGRRILANVRTFTMFLLSANLGEVVLFTGAVAVGASAPMTVVQILAINVLTDGLPAVALSREPVRTETMREPPQRGGALLTGPTWLVLIAIGLIVAAAALAAFALGDQETQQTMAFATVGASELALVFTLRSPVAPAWRAGRNRALSSAVVASLVVLGTIVYAPPLHDPFGTVALGADELAAVLVCALAPATLVELGKGLVRRRRGQSVSSSPLRSRPT
jgi:Ca2+-transporting ATPase